MAVRQAISTSSDGKTKCSVTKPIACAHAKHLVLSRRPLIMGILNVTPDSFSDAGRYIDPDAAIAHGINMAHDGADLIDIGGESTRPGAQPVSIKEELERVIPIIHCLSKRLSVPLSVDTYKAQVAREAISEGASIVNDVTALRHDPLMADVVARSKAAVILMHMRKNPQTMQQSPRYRNVVSEVALFLKKAANHAEQSDIERSRIMIDPGLGFGKTVAHNLRILAALDEFISLGYPVVLGPSRKSFIGKTLNAEVNDRLSGTLACLAVAKSYGVHIVRVHDVKAAVHFIRMIDAIDAAS